MLARQQGRLTEATVVLEWCVRRAEALGLHPTSIDAQTALASVALARGEATVAEVLYQEAVRRSSETSWNELALIPALDGFALATFPHRPELAIQVVSAVATWRRTMSYPREPAEEQRIARALRGARGSLPPAVYERAWALGLLDGALRTAAEEVVRHHPQPAPSARVAHSIEMPSPDRATIASLTRQERVVLCHIVGGASNQEVADTLSISSRTVAKHVENILAKLEVGNRTAAAAMAVLSGLCRPDAA
jgi:DNA-binding CsgD family transcriptional regulator